MTHKEKAKELIEKFKDKVNPYIGSGMLSNTHDDSAILWQSKKCALIAVDELIQLRKGYFDCTNPMQDESYWQQVKKEIEKL